MQKQSVSFIAYILGQTQGRWRWSGVSERHVPRKHDVTDWERQTEAEDQIHAWDNRDAH